MHLKIDQLFRTSARILYPQSIQLEAELCNVPGAHIDVIITTHNFPELANATIKNYLCLEKESKLHLIVVESSGRQSVFDKIYRHPQVSRILLKTDIDIRGHVHGYGSYGMALSSAVGAHFSQAPLIFFSHSDMLATKENFLSWLAGKLVGKTRLASFTQRHFIPFTGCMLMTRDLLQEQNIDWAPLDTNEVLGPLGLENLAKTIHHLRGIDCGEQYVYSELQRGNPVFVCASRGGSKDWWHDPLDYYNVDVTHLWKQISDANLAMTFAPLQTNRTNFEQTYAHVLRASTKGWWPFEKSKFWRYSFDDQGDLVFIHYGRGTTLRAVRRWLRFAHQR